MKNLICEDGEHEYAEKICEICGFRFCWSCCATTNVHEWGIKIAFMECPNCGHDYWHDKQPSGA